MFPPNYFNLSKKQTITLIFLRFKAESTVTIMDLESYETFDAEYPVDEVALKKVKELHENPDEIGESQAEYWSVMGRKLVTRIMN